MSGPGTYAALFRVPGARAFSGAGLVARMPASMVRLAIVLLATAHGSYAEAGVLSAAYVIVSSALGPLQARLADRFGQRFVLPLATLVHTAGLGLLVVAVMTGAALGWSLLCSCLAGAAAPPVGSYVRTRWVRALNGSPRLQTAFAVEAFLDEIVFIVGPTLVTMLATGVSPALGVLSAAGFGLVGSLALALLRGSEPPAARPAVSRPVRVPLGMRRFWPALLAYWWLGVLFGGAEIVVVALASAAGRPVLAGPLLAAWAAGSLVAAAVVGALPPKRPPLTRFRLGIVAVAATMLPLPFVDHLGLLAVVLFVAGSTLAPTLVAGVGVVHSLVPTERLTEGIAWTSAIQNAGFALGAALVGPLIDTRGPHLAAIVPLTAGLLAALAVAWPAFRPQGGDSPGSPQLGR